MAEETEQHKHLWEAAMLPLTRWPLQRLSSANYRQTVSQRVGQQRLEQAQSLSPLALSREGNKTLTSQTAPTFSGGVALILQEGKGNKQENSNSVHSAVNVYGCVYIHPCHYAGSKYGLSNAYWVRSGHCLGGNIMKAALDLLVHNTLTLCTVLHSENTNACS